MTKGNFSEEEIDLILKSMRHYRRFEADMKEKAILRRLEYCIIYDDAEWSEQNT